MGSAVPKDFDAKGVAQSDQHIRTTMTASMEEAVAQIKSGSSSGAIFSRRQTSDRGPSSPDRLALPGVTPSPAGSRAAKPSIPAGAAAAPIVAETIARQGFKPSPSISSTTLGHRRHRDRHRRDPVGRRRRSCACRSALRRGQPCARLRRRGHHRADDQDRRRCRRPLSRDEFAARRASWGPTRAMTLCGISDMDSSARGEREHGDAAMIETRPRSAISTRSLWCRHRRPVLLVHPTFRSG